MPEDLGALALRSQSRSDDRAASMLEQMADSDPLMRGHHLAAAARFRQRAGLCRDQVDDQHPVPADDTDGDGAVSGRVRTRG
ncbi:hypothetical protein E1293_03315 [Actinomadura darangshiensis]|uniref:Tetratricopeptide repeat protein n=1 Tax=Actinomadura darangshiensis TaxID=705336 RepID=A0A4R5C101_9ACTN|nr:hypothetical protein [Actinomadura darangshiensis]TDD90424.1 hypothetical protein E1293_03315 [Actinomadura darangshiensis]